MLRPILQPLALTLSIGLTVSGCSLLTVKGPPETPNQTRHIDCTTSYTAPILDVIIGVALGSSAAVGVRDSAPDAQVPLFFLWFTPFSTSSAYGFKRVSDCNDAHESTRPRGRADAPFGASARPVPGVGYRSTPLQIKAAKYTAFFNHVKQRVDEALVCPQDTSQLAGAPAGQRWQSRLMVVMTKDGAVQAVTLDSSSGRDDVDQAAIAAMKAAGPFTAPPSELFQPDGTAEFRFAVGCVGDRPRR